MSTRKANVIRKPASAKGATGGWPHDCWACLPYRSLLRNIGRPALGSWPLEMHASIRKWMPLVFVASMAWACGTADGGLADGGGEAGTSVLEAGGQPLDTVTTSLGPRAPASAFTHSDDVDAASPDDMDAASPGEAGEPPRTPPSQDAAVAEREVGFDEDDGGGEPSGSRFGLALSFDDRAVDLWYEARPLFQRFDARVTFYVSKFDKFSPEELDQFSVLASDGHEIACHGLRHVRATEIVEQESIQYYLDVEILPAIAAMEEAGFSPTSFAYPFGDRSRALDRALLEYFRILRTGGGDQDTALEALGEPRLVRGMNLDMRNNPDFAPVLAALDDAAEKDRILVAYSHRITDDPNLGRYITPKRLEALFTRVNRLGGRYYTMSELAMGGDH